MAKKSTMIRVEFIERDKIREIGDLLWNMQTVSYADIGGLKAYRSKEHFLSMAKYAKVAYYGESIVACSIYRNMLGGYKLMVLGCNQGQSGKEGIRAITQDDIAKLDLHYWVEASGEIERYFKKHNGCPMPNFFASKILGTDDESIRLSKKDMVHYERAISEEWFEKIIFGIQSEDIYNAVIAEVEDYSRFLKSVNNIHDKAVPGLKYSLKQAYYIAENILRANEEDGFNELIPSWYDALHDVLKTFRASEQTQSVEDYIEYCDYLLKTMPQLELHKIEF